MPLLVFSQELPVLFQDYLEQNETIDEEILTTIYERLENPIDLNECSVYELKQLPFINRQQAQSIVNYRKEKGYYRSVYELQAIKGLDRQSIRWLLPFVHVTTDATPSFTEVQHQWRLYAQRFLEQESDYINGHFVGNPYKSYLTYSAQSKSMLGGITIEKDAGEQWLDFYSMYATIKGKNNRLILGDYQLSLGQGLLCYQGFSFSKSAQVLSTFKQANVLRPHTSSREYQYQRGAAYEHRLKHWQLSIFLSSNKQDANVLDSTLIVTSVQETGLHRTASELEDKRQLKHRLVGAQLALEKQHFKSSIYSLVQQYDKRLILGSDTLDQLWGIAWDYSITYKNAHFFGEYAYQNKSMAFLTALNAQLAPNLSFSALYRNYASDYHAKLSNAFAEQSNTRNERGLYTALSLEITDHWNLSFYADVFYFPEASFYSQSPLRGNDYFLQLIHRVRKKWQWSARLKYELKNQNLNDDVGLSEIDIRKQLNGFVQTKYIMSHFNFKSRVNWNRQDEEMGYLLAQEMSYRPFEKPWSITARFVVFDTPSFASRIYAYEPDVMYSFSVPFHYGEGRRTAVVAKYKFNNVTLNVKLAQTQYFDRTPVKGGRVQGNKSTEVKLVLKWVL